MNTAQDIISAYLSAFNRGDWPGMLALLADDVVQHAGTHPHCRAVARLAPQRLRQPANRRHRATVPH